MPAYMIARATITDREKFEKDFMPAVAAAFGPYGAKLLAQSDDVRTLVGSDHLDHLAIAEFPSHDAAVACANSAEFRHAVKVSETCITNHFIRLIDGVPQNFGEQALMPDAAMANA